MRECLLLTFAHCVKHFTHIISLINLDKLCQSTCGESEAQRNKVISIQNRRKREGSGVSTAIDLCFHKGFDKVLHVGLGAKVKKCGLGDKIG